MAQFEVDFSESLSQLAQFQIRLANMGKALDTLEAKSEKSTSASSKLLRNMNTEYDKLEKILVASGADAEKLGKTMQTVRDNVNLMMSGVAANNVKATVAAQAYNGELAEMGRLMNDTAAKNAFAANQQKILLLTTKLANENDLLRAKIAATDTALGKSNANLKVNLAHKQNMATVDQRLRVTGDNLVLTLASMSNEQGKSNVMTQAYIAHRRSQITEEFRLDTQLRSLQKTLEGLTGGQQEEITKVQQLIAARKAEITETAREDLQLKKLRETLVSLTGGRQQEIALVNAQIAARRKVIAESITEKKVVDEMTAALKREEAQLVRLQAQAQMGSSYHGQRVAQLKEEIKAQERHNKLLALSTPALLGFGAAQEKVNISKELGSQSAAMLRAGLTGLHASVGMYTSATIIGATATYALSAALRDSVVTGAEFYATMSRTKAIMSSGDVDQGWLTNAEQSSKALEMQVRALGQTTVFTASEVGDGLQQLGMAGLSANEALVALKPSLQLANLANVSMARSADISTNVLMTFGMQASELQGVVDLMATAVNNSNADIEQLANSLSYAGPAAKTAGFSIQETTAAIETMANSGIKGSRSGSALRRMFTNLLNPTKKGSEVIQKYGLDILDAEGNTRSLSNIIQQLSTKLKDLPGPERLAAITNLVGVYASSAVTGLVDNADTYAKFAEQNQNVAGAGDRMEKIISDNLKFDWKEMLSGLEEVQLQAFSQLDMRMREATAGMTKYVLELMEPYKEGTDITGLDRILVQAQTSAEAIARVVAGIVAYKFATGNVFGALASDAQGAAERLKITADRMHLNSSYLNMMGSASDGARTRMDMLTASTGRGAAVMSTMGNAAAWTAGKLSTLASVAGGVMRALGWVGLIYGIGSALYEVFSTNTDEEVLKHRDSIDDVKSSYDELKRSIEETGLARQRAALKEQIGADKQGVLDLSGKIKSTEQLIANGRAAGVPEEAMNQLTKRLEGLKALVGTYDDKVTESEASLAKLGHTTNDYSTEADWQATRIERLIGLTNDLTIAQGKLTASQSRDGLGLNNLKAAQEVGRLTQEKALAQKQVELGTGQLLRVQNNVRPFSETIQTLEKAAQEKANEKVYEKTTSNAQQLLDIETKITEAKAAQQKLITKDQNAIAAGNTDARPGLQLAEASVNSIASLEAKRLVLQQKMTEEQQALNEARDSASATQRSDNENLSAFQKQAAEIAERIRAAENPADGKAMDVKAVTDLYKDQARVLGQIKGLESKSAKAGAKAGRTDDRQAESDLRAYTALAKKFDEVSYAQLDLKKGTEAMQRLRAAGTITAQQEAKALGELNLAYYNAVNALDENYVALEKLRSAYSQSPFGIAAQDLATLNRALDEGKMGLEEYNRIYLQITDKQKEQAISGLPTANLTMGEASSSPFSDFVSVATEFGAGNKQFEERQKELDNGVAIQLAAAKAERDRKFEHYELMYKDQEEYAAKALRAEQQYQDTKRGILVTADNQTSEVMAKAAQFQEEMSQMALIGMMATAGNVLGMFASAAEDATGAQKAAFLAQKALAVAQILVYTHVAAARAGAELGPFGLPLAAVITATGYANAALVGAMAVAQLTTGKSGSGGGGGGPTMYDTGGYIPYNRTGIVGEYGPELVTGPAHVTGRGNSAAKLKSNEGGDGGGLHLTLAPVFQVAGGGGEEGSSKDPGMLAKVFGTLFMKFIGDAIRPNGILDNWYRNKRNGG